MSSAMSAAAGSLMPALPELGAPSRLSVAFWLALAAESALVLALVWVVAHPPAARAPARPAEQVRLVHLQKPAQKPKVKFKRPTPQPLHDTFHPQPVPLPPPPVALPPAIPLPPSPIAAASPPPPPPKAQPQVNPGQKLSYLSAVRASIQGAVQFPSTARMLRMEGRVRVKFELVDGVVSDLRIITPGRLKAFNSNALLAVHDASIPPPPKALKHHVFELMLWVKFHLHRAL